MASSVDFIKDWLRKQQINIWDEKYDYVTHNDHWLTTIWSDDCEKCRASGKPKPVISTSATATCFPLPKQETNNTGGNTVIKPITSSASSTSLSGLPQHKSPTLTNGLASLATTVSADVATPVVPKTLSAAKSSEHVATNPPMTPIQPANISTKAFVTPYSSNKFNDTYTRSTRRSARKQALDKTCSDQDLINLNETYDMYKSALASTPSGARKPETINEDSEKQGPLLDLATPRRPLDSTITRSASKAATTAISSTPMQSSGAPSSATAANGLGNFLPPPRPRNNFELLQAVGQTNGNTNNHNSNSNNLLDNHEEHEHAQPVTSKIPRIPVRTSRVHDS